MSTITFPDFLNVSFPQETNTHANLGKWVKYGQNPDLYHSHSDFSSFMETSGLLSQIKITHDVFQEIDGEPAINVNGEWMKWSLFKNEFKAVYSERYKETFIIHKENKVYTYLDNGKGLQPFHPFLSEGIPTSVISDEEYTKTLEKAHEFIREDEKHLTDEERKILNEKRTHILQIVTSYADGPDTHFNNVLTKPKHPCMRRIIGSDNPELNVLKGEVYEVGYIRKNKMLAPLANTQGCFRSPDIYEYLSYNKVVTNIPVTPEESQSFADYISEYHRGEINIGNPIAYHLTNQNCTTFVQAALASAHVKVPTKITLNQLLAKIVPLWAVKTAQVIQNLAAGAVSLAKYSIQILPDSVKNPVKETAQKIKTFVHEAFETFTALVCLPLKIALGEALGTGGRAFACDDGSNTSCNLKSVKRWFSLSSYTLHLPGILYEWQREQASTVVYKNPVRLCIVP